MVVPSLRPRERSQSQIKNNEHQHVLVLVLYNIIQIQYNYPTYLNASLSIPSSPSHKQPNYPVSVWNRNIPNS